MLARLAALLASAVRVLGDGRSFVWRRRRLRIAAIALLIATPLLAGGYYWLRGSSLVAVKSVHVSGAHGSDAHAIDTALKSAALRMTTLDVHQARCAPRSRLPGGPRRAGQGPASRTD